jgi:hypothetical protein
VRMGGLITDPVNAHDLGPHVRKQHSCERPGTNPCKFHDLQTRERTFPFCPDIRHLLDPPGSPSLQKRVSYLPSNRVPNENVVGAVRINEFSLQRRQSMVPR